jgi:hypothetical protein
VQIQRLNAEIILNLLRNHGAGLAIDLSDDNSGAFLCESTGNSPSDSVATASDDRNSVEQALV